MNDPQTLGLGQEHLQRERERELTNVHAANKADGTARLSVFDV